MVLKEEIAPPSISMTVKTDSPHQKAEFSHARPRRPPPPRPSRKSSREIAPSPKAPRLPREGGMAKDPGGGDREGISRRGAPSPGPAPPDRVKSPPRDWIPTSRGCMQEPEMSGEPKADRRPPWVLIGFGNQARAWALNLRDSGRRILIALREGGPLPPGGAGEGFRDRHPRILAAPVQALRPSHPRPRPRGLPRGCPLPRGSRVVYAHGASCVADGLPERFPELVHLLLAPKAIGSEVRSQYLRKGKLGAVHSAEFSPEPAKDERFLKSLARDLGITGGPYPATFRQEATADLLSEQGLLCGLIPHAALQAFETLRARGIPPELAFMECWLEVKLIANAMLERGPAGLFRLISPHALIGSERARGLLLDKNREKLERLCAEIENGDFFLPGRQDRPLGRAQEGGPLLGGHRTQQDPRGPGEGPRLPRGGLSVATTREIRGRKRGPGTRRSRCSPATTSKPRSCSPRPPPT